MNVNGIVYLITNDVNNHRYVGITTLLLKRRWSAHKKDSKHLNYPLYKSIRKYGIENFSIKPLIKILHFDKNKLINKLEELEKKYIKKYKSYIGYKQGGYNLTEGGNIANITVESRKKQSHTMRKKYKENPQFKKIIGQKVKDAYENNPELRIKAGISQKKRYKKIEEREKTSLSIKMAYKKDPSLRKKLSEIHKQLNIDRPELGEEHSKRISGHNHPRFNNSIYVFKNENKNEQFIGTSYDFRMKFKLNQGKISLLINKKRKSHKGWVIKFDKIPI